MLADEPEIASTLGTIVRVICVDEVQDIQDLQYGILSKIYMAAATKPTVYFVGDKTNRSTSRWERRQRHLSKSPPNSGWKRSSTSHSTGTTVLHSALLICIANSGRLSLLSRVAQGTLANTA